MNIMNSTFNKHSRFGGGDPAQLEVKKPKNMFGGKPGYGDRKFGSKSDKKAKARKV